MEHDGRMSDESKTKTTTHWCWSNPDDYRTVYIRPDRFGPCQSFRQHNWWKRNHCHHLIWDWVQRLLQRMHHIYCKFKWQPRLHNAKLPNRDLHRPHHFDMHHHRKVIHSIHGWSAGMDVCFHTFQAVSTAEYGFWLKLFQLVVHASSSERRKKIKKQQVVWVQTKKKFATTTYELFLYNNE